jgi:hypothetical protein
MKNKFQCGAFTVVGPIDGKPGVCGHKRLMCSSLRCNICQKKRLTDLRTRISELAHRNRLTQFVTLTLDPKKLKGPEESYRYIKTCWRKMRVILSRRFGASIAFIAVLEFQKSGFAHLHILVSVLITQKWLSEAWQAIGGGKIVDIRAVDVHRVSSYLTSFLVGSKIADTLIRLPLRTRIFSASRGFSLSGRRPKSKWWLNRHSIEAVHAFCPDPSNEKRATLGTKSSLLVYFEGWPTVAAYGDLDGFSVLRHLAHSLTKGHA